MFQGPSDDRAEVTVRELVAPLWRQRKVMVATCIAVLAVVVLSAVFLTDSTYNAEMTLLVRRERVDPLVTPDEEVRAPQVNVSEGELLSEVELLRSHDLLRQVVVDAGLVERSSAATAEDEADSPAIARQVSELRSRLQTTPVRRTTMIRVVYEAENRTTAARVLDSLAKRYLEKHLAVHRPAGTHEFFAEQTARASATLMVAQARLMAFAAREHVTDPTAEKAALQQQLTDFDASLQQTRAATADAERRLATVESQLQTTPDRQVTSVSTGSNSGLVSDLTSRVLQLELQREELARKFTAQYPPLVQLEIQLEHTRAALRVAKASPILNETSDRNPTHEWLRTEAARIRSERDALRARAAATAQTVQEYRDRAQTLEEQSHVHQQLVRDVKVAEESYLLYQRKQEEARISDALDSTRITNVTIADPPTIPQTATNESRAFVLLAGAAATLLVGMAAAYLADWLRPSFGSARDVEDVLHVPVLAKARGIGR